MAKNVVVLVDDRHGSSLESVAAAIEKDGAHVEKVLRSLKTIVGSVSDDAAIERVRRMDGVAAVREERTVTLPPMHQTIPQ